MQYEGRILHALLDSYENSLLSRGENRVTIHISLPFPPKTMPAYFDESSLEYEKIHAAVRHLESLGYVQTVWKGRKENHIIQKVVLREENVAGAYQYVKRTPKSDQCRQQLETLERLFTECRTPVSQAFLSWLMERLQQGKSVKEYLELSDLKESERLVRAITAIEENQEECYLREFSVRCFGDSKLLENRLGLIGKIMKRFSGEYENMETDAILAEHGIYHTPNYVYVKGVGSLRIGRGNGALLDLCTLRQGIGLSGEDLDSLQLSDLSQVKKVITIENLTTFFRWQEKDSMLIYLGGYHNTIRRKLLQNIYAKIPQAEYLHFGDIDVGGFEIYRDLCQKTKIPFRPYLMGIQQLQQYESCTRKLTENDRKRIGQMLEKEKREEIVQVLKYMEEKGVKLEQESIVRDK